MIAACGGDDATVAPQAATVAPPTATSPPAVGPTAVPATQAPTATQAPAATAMPEPSAASVGTTSGSLGTYLVDGDGMTLYMFTRDERNKSNCSGGCADAWPPLMAADTPTASEGLDQERFETITRDDGGTQAAFNGLPLYYYAADEKPGDTLGQDVGGVWYVVSTDGGPIRTAASVNAAEDPTLGTMLVDASGRALYLFTRDVRNQSNCAGGCALAWPPLLTIDDPVAGEGVTQDRLATISRDDGSSQVAYNGLPLYYYAPDEKPGDTLGQDRGEVWYVVSTDGGAIRTAASVNAAEDPTLGTMLVDASGRALYLFTRDVRNQSNCAGGCALAWPPLLTIDDPVAGEGVTQDRLATISRDDGSSQVAYNGLPLYYYAPDEKPGDTLGQDVGGVWYVVSTDGGAIRATASVNAGENPDHGTILVDPSGRTLYLFTNDTPGVSNCAGGCALAWPPLLTVTDAAAGEGVNQALLGSTTRADGSSQVTYDGMPLYYFAPDEKPGDTLGQDVGEVWYVINPAPPVVIALGEDNSSGQTGWAKLSGWGDSTRVELSLSSGALRTGVVHIHEGQCGADTLGGVAHALTDFVDGSGASLTTVPASLASLLTGGFAVNTHELDNASVYTSCGNIPAAADTLSVALSEMNDSGQSGWATLTSRGEQTEVALAATAGISELNHIHEGSCETLGGVAHGLTNMADGASVTTVDATLASLLTGGFAVNLHQTGDASVYTSCGNIVSAKSPVLIALGEDNSSGQSGWAKLSGWGAATHVELSLSAGALSTELVHIHSGQCGADTLGGVEHGLTNFTDGSGPSLTIIPASLASLLTGGFAVNTHELDNASVYSSCGNIPAAADTISVALSEMNDSGQSGWATLTSRGGQTEVVLAATAGISELNHIHEGSCDTLGGVAHGLTNMADGASVTTVEAALATLLTGGFAVNLHQTGDASVYTSCGDLPIEGS